MQAKALKTGDRYDVTDDRGRVTGGWTATGDAVIGDDGSVYLPVKYHDGQEGTNTWADPETQVPLSWGAGPKYPAGTPEYDAYEAGLKEELAKWVAGEGEYARPPFRTPGYDGPEGTEWR
jgi:hypothetical protein